MTCICDADRGFLESRPTGSRLEEKSLFPKNFYVLLRRTVRGSGASPHPVLTWRRSCGVASPYPRGFIPILRSSLVTSSMRFTSSCEMDGFFWSISSRVIVWIIGILLHEWLIRIFGMDHTSTVSLAHVITQEIIVCPDADGTVRIFPKVVNFQVKLRVQNIF